MKFPLVMSRHSSPHVSISPLTSHSPLGNPAKLTHSFQPSRSSTSSPSTDAETSTFITHPRPPGTPSPLPAPSSSAAAVTCGLPWTTQRRGRKPESRGDGDAARAPLGHPMNRERRTRDPRRGTVRITEPDMCCRTMQAYGKSRASSSEKSASRAWFAHSPGACPR